MTEAVIRTAGAGRTLAVVGDVYRFLATGMDTNGKYALCEALVPPGGGPPPHVHSREEEGFYVLEGEITFTMGDQRRRRQPAVADQLLAVGKRHHVVGP